MKERALVRHSVADRAVYEAEVERLTKLTGTKWTVSGYLRMAGLAYAGKHLAGVAVAVLVTLVALDAHAGTGSSFDDLMPLADPPPAVDMQPKSDHRIETITTSEHRNDRLWRAIDITMLIASTATLTIDWRQTRSAAVERWSDRVEVGSAAMFIGSQPSSGAVDRYFAIAALANVALWAALPARWRSAIPGVVIGIEAPTIARNLPTTRLWR